MTNKSPVSWRTVCEILSLWSKSTVPKEQLCQTMKQLSHLELLWRSKKKELGRVILTFQTLVITMHVFINDWWQVAWHETRVSHAWSNSQRAWLTRLAKITRPLLVNPWKRSQTIFKRQKLTTLELAGDGLLQIEKLNMTQIKYIVYFGTSVDYGENWLFGWLLATCVRLSINFYPKVLAILMCRFN